MFRPRGLLSLLTALPLLIHALDSTIKAETTPLPLIIWHGLGDSYLADTRYTSPNTINGYSPLGQQPPGYLPSMQCQSDPRSSVYFPSDHSVRQRL